MTDDRHNHRHVQPQDEQRCEDLENEPESTEYKPFLSHLEFRNIDFVVTQIIRADQTGYPIDSVKRNEDHKINNRKSISDRVCSV